MDYPLKMLIHHFFLFIHKSALFFMNTMTLHVCSVRDFKMWSMEASTWLILWFSLSFAYQIKLCQKSRMHEFDKDTWTQSMF